MRASPQFEHRSTTTIRNWGGAVAARLGVVRLPGETTILRLRHLLEKHELATHMLRAVNGIAHARGVLMKTGTVAMGVARR